MKKTIALYFFILCSNLSFSHVDTLIPSENIVVVNSTNRANTEPRLTKYALQIGSALNVLPNFKLNNVDYSAFLV